MGATSPWIKDMGEPRLRSLLLVATAAGSLALSPSCRVLPSGASSWPGLKTSTCDRGHTRIATLAAGESQRRQAPCSGQRVQCSSDRLSPHNRLVRLSRLHSSASPSENNHDQAPPMAFLMLIVGLQTACFGCIGTALPPALRASGLEPAAVAILLGKLGSASAFCEVMLSGSFGKLADAVGRKPILVLAPAITVMARSLVVFSPTLPVLIGVRLVTTLVVPVSTIYISKRCSK